VCRTSCVPTRSLRQLARRSLSLGRSQEAPLRAIVSPSLSMPDALDAMLEAITGGTDGKDLSPRDSLGKLLEHLANPKPVLSNKPELRRLGASKGLKADQPSNNAREQIDPYTNAVWRPNTGEGTHRKREAVAKEPEGQATPLTLMLVETLREIGSSSAAASTPSRTTGKRPWRDTDTHNLVESLCRSSVRSTLSQSQSHPHLRSSPRRTPTTISRHNWDGWSREQTIAAVSMMHSPGQLRGYSRELSVSPRHQHWGYRATAYNSVACRYPGGSGPQSDPRAASFMKGLGPVVRVPAARPPQPETRSPPRLCTRFS